MRSVFDALCDIIILAILVFTVICNVEPVFMKYILTIAGCGAMFNNMKYLYFEKKKKQEDNK